ncbi:probable carboxylesterase 15 [Hordeum vulgare subsp. vulgare]|uniref:Alpha/beta hydrolase fold-3 domain-containing protein n=2 Tax=Hordeum vulgare subsp. vulgare TaxID=112509 RepID=A0A8I6YVU3_HORVV|nr:probable carboxylesterase 15 [Hordeum vulgare subsp. vulgare]
MAFSSPPHVVEDVPPFLQLLSDGTVIRFTDGYPLPIPSPPPGQPVVDWKDVVYDASHSLKLRIYRPAAASSSGNKLPVVVYFHGGGYTIGSFDMPNFHACCVRLAGELPAVVVSADYRLAPEHRFPAGLDDAANVVSWVRAQAAAVAAAEDSADPWLSETANFGQVFVAGDSAGGGVVHHTAVRLASGRIGPLDPVCVAGCAMLCPLFGGEARTASEAEFPPGPFLSLPAVDQAWRLVLPAGSTRDHPLANPFGPDSPVLDGVALPPMLVVTAEHDLLRDRAADYAARLKAIGKPMELVEFEGQHHGFFAVEPYGDAGSEVVRLVKRFVYGNGGASD